MSFSNSSLSAGLVVVAAYKERRHGHLHNQPAHALSPLLEHVALRVPPRFRDRLRRASKSPSWPRK